MTDIFETSEDEIRYLLFRLGGELYGTPLLGIREVVEPQDPKPVPNTVPYFSGVINIRGQVVGVLDLRQRFQHACDKHSGMALMVFDTEAGPLGALVDRIEAVVPIPDTNIEKKPNVRTTVPLEFLIGIGNQEGKLVTLVDLNRILGREELRAIHV